MEMEKKGEQQNQNQKKALRGPVQFWYMGSHMATFWCCAAAAGGAQFGVRTGRTAPAHIIIQANTQILIFQLFAYCNYFTTSILLITHYKNKDKKKKKAKAKEIIRNMHSTSLYLNSEFTRHRVPHTTHMPLPPCLARCACVLAPACSRLSTIYAY